MGGLPDPEWYLDNVLVDAVPGGPAARPPGPAGTWQAWWREAAKDAPEPLAAAAAHGFVLSSAEQAALGITRSASRAAVKRGDWTRAGRGSVAPLRLSGAGDDFLDERRQHAVASTSLARARPGHLVAARSAGILHGLPVFATPPEPQLLARARAGLGRRSSGHAFGAAVAPEDIEDWFGVPVSTVARTLVDLARHDRLDGIMAADAALREHLTSSRAIARALAGAAGWPGVRRARATLSQADSLAESALESVVRLLLHEDGFPPPALQVEIGGYRVDFCWQDQRLVLEADGRAKYRDDALWREKQREHVLRGHGYRVERVLWSDLFRRWPDTAARLWAALRNH